MNFDYVLKTARATSRSGCVTLAKSSLLQLLEIPDNVVASATAL